MDSFDWNDSPVVTNASSSWSNQQHDHVVQQLGPVLVTGTNFISNCRNLLHQEAAKSVPGTSWREAINIEMPYTPNPKDGQITADLGIASQQKTVINGLQEVKAGISTDTGSLDSLNCLISTTNSHTDTSVEDDGISMIFSDCKNSWDNFGTVHAASSGASVSDVSKGKQEDNSHFHTNDFKETFAQTPTDQYINSRRSSSTKLYTTKRSSAHSELKEIPSKSKKPRSDKHPNSSNINLQQPVSSVSEPDSEAMAQMKEMIYRAAAFRSVM
ncbi:transcription factor bHLH [Forsythia ovata]|uniref:Transcription factor bHLH n=1 Tax=Forsythia ovata TaxID=205694 RepID=A0ABD1PG14_9LAMI